MMVAVLFIAVCFVAFTNGANANFKGVASLYGSGTTTLRQAAWWGTGTTFAGSLAAIFLAHGLLSTFSGRGLVPDALVASPRFVCEVAIGAALTSFLSTRLGFPVSTTHALVGALVGAGLAAGGEVRLPALVTLFIYPLIVSPLLAAALGAIVYFLLKSLKLAPDQRTPTLDRLHFLSTGAASFARGVNDTPKMAALMLAVPGLAMHWGFLIIAVAIALGGLLDIRNVAETLAKKITGMNPGQWFAASLVTAGLVATASLHSVPVSTTHVSVGAMTGMGVAIRQAHRKMLIEILIAWVTTVPCGALLAATVSLIISAG